MGLLSKHKNGIMFMADGRIIELKNATPAQLDEIAKCAPHMFELKKPEVEINESTALTLLSGNIDSLDYNREIKPIVRALKIETPDNKKATLIKAVKDYAVNL